MQVYKTKKSTKYREKIVVDGKEFYSPRFDRKSDAREWKARMLNERAKYHSSGVLPLALNQEPVSTLKEYTDMWLETRVKPQLSFRTHLQYVNVLKRHILPRYGHLKLTDIRVHHADELIKILLEKDHNPRGVNLILGVFKRVVIEATRENRIEKNPFQYMKELKETIASDVFLSFDQINSILSMSEGTLFHSLFLFAVNTGMRRGEIAGLCWDKVNFNNNLIEVSRIRDRNGLSNRTKTVKSKRFVPMNLTVREHLLELKEKLPDYRDQNGLVFLHEDGSTFDVDHLFREFRKYQKLLGVKEFFRFHDIRHTFASHFMMNNGNIYDLQKILGHTSLEMTQRYAHLAPEHLVSAANIINFGAKSGLKSLKIL